MRMLVTQRGTNAQLLARSRAIWRAANALECPTVGGAVGRGASVWLFRLPLDCVIVACGDALTFLDSCLCCWKSRQSCADAAERSVVSERRSVARPSVQWSLPKVRCLRASQLRSRCRPRCRRRFVATKTIRKLDFICTMCSALSPSQEKRPNWFVALLNLASSLSPSWYWLFDAASSVKQPPKYRLQCFFAPKRQRSTTESSSSRSKSIAWCTLGTQ